MFVKRACRGCDYLKLCLHPAGASFYWYGHSSTLQHTPAYYNTCPHTTAHYSTLQHTTAHYSTLQHTTAHYSTLPHTTSHYSTLRHTQISHLFFNNSISNRRTFTNCFFFNCFFFNVIVFNEVSQIPEVFFFFINSFYL